MPYLHAFGDKYVNFLFVTYTQEHLTQATTVSVRKVNTTHVCHGSAVDLLDVGSNAEHEYVDTSQLTSSLIITVIPRRTIMNQYRDLLSYNTSYHNVQMFNNLEN